MVPLHKNRTLLISLLAKIAFLCNSRPPAHNSTKHSGMGNIISIINQENTLYICPQARCLACSNLTKPDQHTYRVISYKTQRQIPKQTYILLILSFHLVHMHAHV